VRLLLWGGRKVDLESIEWKSISTQSIPPRLISEFLSPLIAPLSRLILPKLSALVDCCLGWMALHLQAFCMLLATHRHHIVAIPSSSSNCRPQIAVLELPSPSLLPYYNDESIVVVTMAACANKFSSSLNQWSTSRTTVAAANHNGCNQASAVPPCPLSIRLIAMSSGARLLATRLQDCPCCCCATLVAPPPLVCRPLRFAKSLSRRLHLLLPYCAPLVQLVVLLPGGLPPPLSRCPCLSSRLSLCWLSRRVASHCLAPWPSLLLSSHLRLLSRPSCSVGCRVVLPGAPASLHLLLPCSKCIRNPIFVNRKH
jgi:hypothetical protein